MKAKVIVVSIMLTAFIMYSNPLRDINSTTQRQTIAFRVRVAPSILILLMRIGCCMHKSEFHRVEAWGGEIETAYIANHARGKNAMWSKVLDGGRAA